MLKHKKIYIGLFSIIIIQLIIIGVITILYISSSKVPVSILTTTEESTQVEAQGITDNNYFTYKEEVIKAIDATQNRKIIVKATNIGEGGEGSVFLDTYDPINKTFSSIEKFGNWELNFSDFFNIDYLDGQIIRTNSENNKEIERLTVKFDELKPLNSKDLFYSFEPIKGGDSDNRYEYIASLKRADYFSEKTIYYFVVHDTIYDRDEITIVEVNELTGFVTRIEAPDWTGITVYEVTVL